MSSEHRGAAGEGSRSVFQANLAVGWECIREVGLCLRRQGWFLAGSEVGLR